MFTVILLLVVPLFLYCSYLFAKDIKSSYSTHSFKKHRLKTGNKSKEWKPVSLQELKAMDIEIIPALGSNQRMADTANKTQDIKGSDGLTAEKPVIKLYKDATLKISNKPASTEEKFSDKNLLLSIAKEMSLYDGKLNTLFDSYQNKLEEYFAQLSEVVLMSADKQTFVYPLERANGTTMLCYVVTESGVSEESIEISDLANYKLLPDDEATDLEFILREYVNVKGNIQAYISKIKNDNILPLPRATRLSDWRAKKVLPLAVHQH